MLNRLLVAIKKDSIRSILVLFFFFLLIIESASFYLNLQQKKQQLNAQVHYTVDSIASQASLTVSSQKTLLNALIMANRNELINLSLSPTGMAMDFEHGLIKHFNAYYGFQIIGPKGAILYNALSDSYSEEQSVIDEFIFNQSEALNQHGHVELYRHGDNGSIYFAFRLDTSATEWVYLLIARASYLYSDALIKQKYHGFELCLTNTAENRLVVANGTFFNGKSSKPLTSNNCLNNPVLLKKHITNTPWAIYAVEKTNLWKNEFIDLLLPNFLFSFIYLLIAIIVMKGRQYAQRKSGKRIAEISETSQRAEQALNCINEVVITTSLSGKILFCNASAGKWLGNQPVCSVIGKPIQSVFPFAGMPWLHDWKNIPHISRTTNHGDTLVDFNGCLMTLDISQHYSKLNTNEEVVIWVLKDISRQANDRELLDLSRARYRAIYEGTGVGMWHVDISLVRDWLENLNTNSVTEYIEANPEAFHELRSTFQLIDINEAAMELHGSTDRHDFLLHIQEFFHSYNHDIMIQMADHILLNQQKFSLEVDFKNREGESYFFLVNITLDQVGKDQALLSFIDINDRIQAESALKQSENFWASVIQTLPDTVYVNDLVNRKTRFNSRHIAELLGYQKEDISKIEHWRDLIHPEDQYKMERAVDRLRNMDSGEVYETTTRIKHKDGSWHIMRFRDSVFSEHKNELSRYYVGIAKDVTEEEDAKVQLSYSERQYRLLAEGMSDIVFTLNEDLKLSYISSSITKMLGYPSSQIMREGLKTFFYGESFKVFLNYVAEDLENAREKVRTMDLNAHSFDGRSISLEIQSSLLRNEAGKIEGILATCRDVTQKRFIEQEARTASQVFENSSEAILVTNANGIISRVNKAFTYLTGFESMSAIGAQPTEFLSPDSPKEALRDIQEALLVEGYWQGEINYRNKRGEVRPSFTGITALKDDMGETVSLIIISSDIAHRKMTEARIEHLAYFDPLTGLPNRAQMHETLERLMVEEEQMLALLFIDLDRFKPINDTMGHPVGDLVLKEVAQRLRDSIRESDLVSRIGGDEFTVIMPNMKSDEHAAYETINVSERILHQMMQPFNIGERQLYLSASVGIALYPKNCLSGMDLLRNADTAMYHAKAMGKNNFQFYAEEMNIKAMERLELENNLHLALRRNEFELHFQAQWDTKHNKLCGIECLLRWRRPNYGLVGPDKFIPIIEETGLIVPIGEWVLRAACEQIIEWQENGMHVPKISVNLSARQFKDAQMLERICQIVDQTGVDPELIELELTESILMDDVDRTLEILNEARKMGFGLSIDDFGTGYSSLSYLKQFPVNNLKIDKSFIHNLPHNMEDAQITRTIIAMANNLGLGVIAEGVEKQDQKMFLQQVGCHQVQGFMYSHPVSADIFAHDFLEVESIEA